MPSSASEHLIFSARFGSAEEGVHGLRIFGGRCVLRNGGASLVCSSFSSGWRFTGSDWALSRLRTRRGAPSSALDLTLKPARGDGMPSRVLPRSQRFLQTRQASVKRGTLASVERGGSRCPSLGSLRSIHPITFGLTRHLSVPSGSARQTRPPPAQKSLSWPGKAFPIRRDDGLGSSPLIALATTAVALWKRASRLSSAGP
jgi:hypothetical protein